MSKNKNERCIEVKFNSEKEKIFIFLKPMVTIKLYDQLLNLFNIANRNKVYLLPTDYVESVKVIRDIKDNKYKKFIKFLKKDLAKKWGMKVKDLFGKRNYEEIPLTGAEVSKKEFMKTYTSEQIEAIKKEIKIKKPL